MNCPYCGNEGSEDSACCGESGHFETVYLMKNGDFVTPSDYDALIDDTDRITHITINVETWDSQTIPDQTAIKISYQLRFKEETKGESK